MIKGHRRYYRIIVRKLEDLQFSNDRLFKNVIMQDSSVSPSPSPSPFPLDFGFRIWDLDLVPGFETWIWDLDLGPDLGLTKKL